MKWLLVPIFFLVSCSAPGNRSGGSAAVPETAPVVVEVLKPRQCAPLPQLPDNATPGERTAFTRTVVRMYADCARSSD